MHPEATHIWTPAHQKSKIGFTYRRSLYKKQDDVWYSLNINKEWVLSQNEPEWFETEIKEGYFVSMEEFNSPGFTCKPEVWQGS